MKDHSMSMTKKGGVTIPLYHCVFNADGSITHWSHHFDSLLYDGLSNLYLVCIADSAAGARKVVGAALLKTSYHHSDGADFSDAMFGAIGALERLNPLMSELASLLPARIALHGAPPSEREFLNLALQQYLKLGAVNAA